MIASALRATRPDPQRSVGPVARPLSHRGAVIMMIAATLMWSIAGIVSRQLESARGFEVTFWRSFFNALALLVLLGGLRGPAMLRRTIAHGGLALWVSGACWAVMFTAFMMALSLTKVANVLVTMALGPLFTALASRLWLGHRLAARTWWAVAIAGAGIGWMYGQQFQASGPREWLGTLVALGVPLAAALNWSLMQKLSRGEKGGATMPDMLPAVLLGAVISAVATLPLALPLQANGADLTWLALLGVVQLAIPCLMAVKASTRLAAPEISLLALLEVVFGVAWVWWGAREAPSWAVLGGGGLVLTALALNEVMAMREGRAK
jgi:drug/metabolite transporter (DMT)-like permease